MSAPVGRSHGISMPALIGAAQRTYVTAIKDALERRGFDDMPRTAYRIVSALTTGGSSIQALASRLAISKQAASRLVETLVLRGYCERHPDLKDRRKTHVTLTDLGRSAAEEIRSVVKAVDRLLTRHVDSHDLGTTQATLSALAVLDYKELPDRSTGRVRIR